MATELPGFFTAGEAAEYLGMADSLVRRYCRLERIKAKRVGKRNWIIAKAELDRFKKAPRRVGNPNFGHPED